MTGGGIKAEKDLPAKGKVFAAYTARHFRYVIFSVRGFFGADGAAG